MGKAKVTIDHKSYVYVLSKEVSAFLQALADDFSDAAIAAQPDFYNTKILQLLDEYQQLLRKIDQRKEAILPMKQGMKRQALIVSVNLVKAQLLGEDGRTQAFMYSIFQQTITAKTAQLALQEAQAMQSYGFSATFWQSPKPSDLIEFEKRDVTFPRKPSA